MNFYPVDLKQFEHLESSILDNTAEILMTDDNIKPAHVAIPAKNTEFLIRRNSDTLLIIVGESWTYGEALPGIGSGVGKFNLRSQIEHCIGPRMAEILGSDLYQFSIPGNCNLFIHQGLERILNYVSTLNYKKIYVAFLMTENAREWPIIDTSNTEFLKNHPLKEFMIDAHREKMEIRQWLKKYDELFFDLFHNTLKNFTACPIEGLLFRNFTKIATDRRDYNFKIVEETWVEYTAKLLNIDFKAPLLLNAIELESKLSADRDFMEEQLNAINAMFDIIGGHVKKNVYHANHPSAWGHLVWAIKLIGKAGWKDV